MGIVAAVFEFLVGLVKAVPFFDKWFSKPVTQKVEEAKEKARQEEKEFEETGRPKW